LSGQIIETRIKTGVFENEIIQVAAAERRRLEKVSCVGQKQEAAALDKSPPDRKYRCIMQFAAREEGMARERTKTRSRRAPGPDPFALIPCSNRTSASSSTHDGDGPGNENHKRRTVRGSKKIVHGLRDARASDLANCCQAVGTFIPGAVVCPVSMGRFTAGSHQLQLAGKMESI
jgi:hypothetical protein